MFSEQVNWWTVHEFVEPFLISNPGWPMAGSVEWQVLHDGDPRKMAALLDAARHHALRIDTAQEARADASKAIAASADWRGMAQEMVRRQAFLKMHPWASRHSDRKAAA